MPLELQRRLQPDESAKLAPCGLRFTWVPKTPGLPLIDLSCLKPNCLRNGGRCTGVRHVPDPSIPASMAQARARNAQTFVPMPVLRAITRAVRVQVAKKLRRPNDAGLSERSVQGDIDFVRLAHRREMRKAGTYL